MKCGCNHSLAFVCGLFASLAATLLVAQDACLDGGGRLSEASWACEAAGGAIGPLWQFVTPGVIAATLVLVGVPVYFAIAYVGRRWLFRYGDERQGRR